MASLSDVLIIPGLGGSGPQHWQTRWEQLHGYRRVEQREWDNPSLGDWLSALDAALRAQPRPSLLVAHSLGAVLVAHYALQPSAAERVAAALLVSPADVEDPACTPDCTRGFAPLPLSPLPFPSLVVASQNDPYCRLARAEHMAKAWGAAFENVGAAGHINAESGLGAWPEGHRLLARLAG